MDKDQVSETVKAMIQTQIVAAFNDAPDVIEKLVKAALSKSVDSLNGSESGYYGNRVPYIDYLVGDAIRSAARGAVNKIVNDALPLIEAEIRKGLSAEDMVKAMLQAFVGTASQEWKIDVKSRLRNNRGRRGMDSPDDLLEAVARAMAGEGGCCRITDIDGRCCMTERARKVLAVIDDHGGWKPISTAPKDGTHILVCDATRPHQPPTSAHWWETNWALSVCRYGDESDHGCDTLTHWMPLPAVAGQQQAVI